MAAVGVADVVIRKCLRFHRRHFGEEKQTTCSQLGAISKTLTEAVAEFGYQFGHDWLRCASHHAFLFEGISAEQVKVLTQYRSPVARSPFCSTVMASATMPKVLLRLRRCAEVGHQAPGGA